MAASECLSAYVVPPRPIRGGIPASAVVEAMADKKAGTTNAASPSLTAIMRIAGEMAFRLKNASYDAILAT